MVFVTLDRNRVAFHAAWSIKLYLKLTLILVDITILNFHAVMVNCPLPPIVPLSAVGPDGVKRAALKRCWGVKEGWRR